MLSVNQPDVGSELAQCGEAHPLCVIFRNEMTAAFELSQLGFAVDDRLMFARTGTLPKKEYVVFSGQAAPGKHRMQTFIRLDGREQLQGLHFMSESHHDLDFGDAGTTRRRVVIVEFEKAEFRPERRPAIRYEDTSASAVLRPVQSIRDASSCYETFYSGFGVNSGWASYGTNIVALVTVTY